MKRTKTSVYVDIGAWSRFKEYARAKGVTVSMLLERAMEEEATDETLGEELSKMVGTGSFPMEFKPVKATGPVSSLIGRMRSERSLPRQ